jgi:hypothetical protein
MEYSASDYGDSDFLAENDQSIRDFRENEKSSKKEIVKQMVKLRHNLQYNKHLLSVYLKAKTIFDEMVEEHRAQIHHLDEIYRHLSKLIHEQMTRHKSSKKRRDGGVVDNKPMIKELVKDKRKIGKLLSNMRKGLDKLMEIDTIIGTTIEKINEIQFIEDNDRADEDDEDDEDDESEASEDDESEASEEEDEEDDEEDESEASEEDDEEEDDEDAETEAEASEEDDEEEDDEEAEDDDESDEEEEEADDSASEEEADDDDSEASDEGDSDEEPVLFY